MNLEKLGPIAVLAPLAHALVSFVFLYGYVSGFGGGVSSLFSLSDVFGISLNDLVIVYISGLVVPMLVSANQLMPGYRSPLQQARDSGDEARFAQLHRQGRYLRRFALISISLLTISLAFAVFLAIHYDERVPYSELMAPLIAWSGIIWHHFANRLRTTARFDRALYIAIVLFLGAFVFGLTRGQGERRYPRSEFVQSNMHCGDFVVLRAASDRFLAIALNGQRVILEDECKVALALPHRRPFHWVSSGELMAQYFGWSSEEQGPETAKK